MVELSSGDDVPIRPVAEPLDLDDEAVAVPLDLDDELVTKPVDLDKPAVLPPVDPALMLPLDGVLRPADDIVVAPPLEPIVAPPGLPSRPSESSLLRRPSSFSDLMLAKFREFDTRGDGRIDRGECRTVLMNLGMAESAVSEAFTASDLDKDGSLDYEEFVRWLYSKAPLAQAATSTLRLPERPGARKLVPLEVQVVSPPVALEKGPSPPLSPARIERPTWPKKGEELAPLELQHVGPLVASGSNALGAPHVPLLPLDHGPGTRPPSKLPSMEILPCLPSPRTSVTDALISSRPPEKLPQMEIQHISSPLGRSVADSLVGAKQLDNHTEPSPSPPKKLAPIDIEPQIVS
eukprot:TRINITY_DN22324_c0_g1_i1.p1 TRINITY_DN22324_c0_g1~~TRINITY_DN22324_c0_g1_i1.p1  ORF type:complete len:349 (-),score=53.18 TRINITY_DN22324_c0_g1_i1:328-1374(-)